VPLEMRNLKMDVPPRVGTLWASCSKTTPSFVRGLAARSRRGELILAREPKLELGSSEAFPAAARLTSLLKQARLGPVAATARGSP